MMVGTVEQTKEKRTMTTQMNAIEQARTERHLAMEAADRGDYSAFRAHQDAMNRYYKLAYDMHERNAMHRGMCDPELLEHIPADELTALQCEGWEY